MKPVLSAHRALHLAAHAVPILKHLKVTDRTMTMKEFGQAIGLVSQAWKPTHAKQVAIVLSLVQTTFARCDDDAVEFHRISGTNGHDGHWYRGHWRPEQF